MSIVQLTQKQKEAYGYIQQYLEEHGYSPRLDELAKMMGITSISTVHKHIQALKDKGILKNVSKSSRSINVFENERGNKEIPLMGVISAGNGLEPLENPQPISVPSTLLVGSGQYYGLKVSGDSMIEEGILDGDTVIIRSQNVALSGDTVVAIINGSTELATLKKFYLLNDKIELRAANSNLTDWPKQFEFGQVEIRGKFCGLIRKVL